MSNNESNNFYLKLSEDPGPVDLLRKEQKLEQTRLQVGNYFNRDRIQAQELFFVQMQQKSSNRKEIINSVMFTEFSSSCNSFNYCLSEKLKFKIIEIHFCSRNENESSYFKVAIDHSVTITKLPFSYRKFYTSTYKPCKDVAKQSN